MMINRSILRHLYYLSLHLFNLPLHAARRCHVDLNSRVAQGGVLVDSSVGPYSYIASGVYLNMTRVGNYCSIAADVKVGGAEHSWWWGSTSYRLYEYKEPDRQTVIEDDVWIGANAVVRQVE